MIPDAEVISLMCTILTKLDVGEFTVKVNITVIYLMAVFIRHFSGQPP
jgi:histidyl-tRNA synthetase